MRVALRSQRLRSDPQLYRHVSVVNWSSAINFLISVVLIALVPIFIVAFALALFQLVYEFLDKTPHFSHLLMEMMNLLAKFADFRSLGLAVLGMRTIRFAFASFAVLTNHGFAVFH